jgi:predicted methyltransferase
MEIRMKSSLLLSAMALTLLACSKPTPPPAVSTEATAPQATAAPTNDSAKLDALLAAQPEEVKARYAARHPRETIEFFGIQPGMTVVDTLPDRVWYTGLLLDYLGPQGKVIAADYSPQMYSLFGEYAPDPKTKATWPADFLAKAADWRGTDDAQLSAVQYGAIPDEVAGTADVVLVVRALHGFARMEDEGQFMTKALDDIKKMLKPGGIVGVEQHRAPEASSDEWASGDNGYLKQTAVIAAFEKAGFELVDKSEINANPKDQPTEKDFVWRLPPTLATSEKDAALKAKMMEIGESDRMMLKFRAPV